MNGALIPALARRDSAGHTAGTRQVNDVERITFSGHLPCTRF